MRKTIFPANTPSATHSCLSDLHKNQQKLAPETIHFYPSMYSLTSPLTSNLCKLARPKNTLTCPRNDTVTQNRPKRAQFDSILSFRHPSFSCKQRLFYLPCLYTASKICGSYVWGIVLTTGLWHDPTNIFCDRLHMISYPLNYWMRFSEVPANFSHTNVFFFKSWYSHLLFASPSQSWRNGQHLKNSTLDKA